MDASEPYPSDKQKTRGKYIDLIDWILSAVTIGG